MDNNIFNMEGNTKFSMELGEIKKLDVNTSVIRVPGGWVVRTMMKIDSYHTGAGVSVHTVFVPMAHY